jgi:uncharacterized membrane protein required for colicin V production
MTAEAIYLLCAATSCFCFVLLLRGYLRNRTSLLLWSSAAFLAFTLANVLLVIDLILLPDVDLTLYRNGITLIGLVLLLCGLALGS